MSACPKCQTGTLSPALLSTPSNPTVACDTCSAWFSERPMIPTQPCAQCGGAFQPWQTWQTAGARTVHVRCPR